MAACLRSTRGVIPLGLGSPPNAGIRQLSLNRLSPSVPLLKSLSRQDKQSYVPRVPQQRSHRKRNADKSWKVFAAIAAGDQGSQSHQQALESLPVLSAEEVIRRLGNANHGNTGSYRAMYSSLLRGITRDAAAMVVPIDEHMVHRGHAVFDTALISDGYLYELDAHLDRILRSASQSKIYPPFPRDELRRIVIETAAASGLRDGMMRYWLSVGPGGFGLSSSECSQATFYVMALANPVAPHTQQRECGVKVITSSMPIKAPQFAQTKSTNYLPNALALMEAEEQGAYASIWLDEEGFVGEGPSMNVAFVSQEGELLVPQFDRILKGCTMTRVMTLAEQHLLPSPYSTGFNSDSSSGKALLSGVRVRRVTVEEGRAAAEMMLCGSSTRVKPVLQWDNGLIGDGKPGKVTLALQELLNDHMTSAPDPYRIKISYRDSD